MARGDLASIIEYIADSSTDAALFALERIERAACSLSTMPLRGPVVPELARMGIQAYRQITVAPWRIVYSVSGTSVRVHAVVDSRSNVEDSLLERLVR